MHWLATSAVRRRGWIVAIWVIAAAGLAPQARRLSRELAVIPRIQGSEAAAVERELATRFASPFARSIIAVVTGVPSPRTPEGRAILDSIVAQVREVPGVAGTLSWLNLPDTMFAGAREGAVLLVGIAALDARPDTMVPPLRAAGERALVPLRDRYPSATLRWTGDVALTFDMRRLSAEDARAAEVRVLPLTLLLLLAAFGATVAAVLPVLAGALAIAIALGLAVLVNEVWSLSIFVQNTITMIGLALGIDYALLIVGRFREALGAGHDPRSAAIEAGHRGGATIALSGLAVLIGFGALFLLPVDEIAALGVGGVLAVVVSMLVAMTLLPALLSWLGDAVNRWRLPGFGRRRTDGAPGWRWWGRFVVRHPVLVLVLGTAPLGVLAWQARRLEPELPRGDWLPPSIESARGLTDLAGMERGGAMNIIRVLLELPGPATLLDEDGWLAMQRVADSLARDPRAARVHSLASVVPDRGFLVLGLVPDRALSLLATPDRRVANIEIVPVGTVDPVDLAGFVREIRRIDAPALTGLPGATLRVGGTPAMYTDYTDAIGARLWTIIGLVLAGAFLALAVGFRSVLIPVKAVLLNLLSVGAAFGAVVLVFQEGHGAHLLGLSGPLHGVFPAVPITAFCIVFGLSLDYEVFLLSRVSEARTRMDEASAIVEGLAQTGGLITSAAAIMIVVFGAFAFGRVLLIQVLGFALAAAVLFDATLVRVAVGPALLALAGKWNWWPGGRGRRRNRGSADVSREV